MSDHKATMIPARGWRLENKENNRFAFYTVVLVGRVLVFHWGRIGSAGQTKLQELPESAAHQAAIRQVATKMGRGYEAVNEDVAFQVDERDVKRALERPDAKSLTLLFDRALRNPQFTGDKDNVVEAYDTFLYKAQRLMDSVANPLTRFESAYNDFEDIKAAWTEIEDKHSLAQTTLDMTTKMLSQALISGSLS